MGARPSFNPEVPSVARTYDYLLGGKDNYPVDREVGDMFNQKFPGMVQLTLDNRACLVRAVTFMAGELGIAQFIDLGSGLPTADNVHQVAQRANPAAKVAYVDNDPIVLAHGRAMLAEDERTVVVKADIREPGQILADPAARGLIDFGRPVAVIASAVLHHLMDDEDPFAVIHALCAATPAGSCLFVSHLYSADDPDSAALETLMVEAFGRGALRTNEQIARFFGDMRLIAPGIVPCARWRPDTDPGELTHIRQMMLVGLGRKPDELPAES